MKTDVPQLKLPDVPAVRLSFYGWPEGSGTCKAGSIDGTETRAERPSWISGNAGVLAKTMRCPAKTTPSVTGKDIAMPKVMEVVYR
jgi:hypothetical protein